MFPDDNRSERRYACEARLLGAATTAFSGTVLDLSSVGLCLVTSTPLEPGRQLHLEFELPGGHVEVVGEVRRVATRDGAQELGLRFVRISADALEIIKLALGAATIVRGNSPR